MYTIIPLLPLFPLLPWFVPFHLLGTRPPLSRVACKLTPHFPHLPMWPLTRNPDPLGFFQIQIYIH